MFLVSLCLGFKTSLRVKPSTWKCVFVHFHITLLTLRDTVIYIAYSTTTYVTVTQIFTLLTHLVTGRCDWLPDRARWSYFAPSELPAVSRIQNFPKAI